MIYKRFELSAEEYDNAPVITKIFLNLVNKILPQHNEITLLLLGSTFLITYVINTSFKNAIVDVGNLNPDSGFFIFLFFICCAYAIISTLFFKPTPFLNSFIAPILIVGSSIILTLEYIRVESESGGYIGIIFALYHAFIVCLLLVFFEAFADLISSSNVTEVKNNFIEKIIAIVVIIFSFLVSYDFTNWYQISWALPISITFLTWNLLDNLGIFKKIYFATSVIIKP